MRTFSVAICFILLCLLCGFCNALMIYQNDTQLIRTSDQIVYGKIVDVKSVWNAQKTHIETTAQVLVDEAFVQSNNLGINSGTTVPVTVLGEQWVILLNGSKICRLLQAQLRCIYLPGKNKERKINGSRS